MEGGRHQARLGRVLVGGTTVEEFRWVLALLMVLVLVATKYSIRILGGCCVYIFVYEDLYRVISYTGHIKIWLSQT